MPFNIGWLSKELIWIAQRLLRLLDSNSKGALLLLIIISEETVRGKPAIGSISWIGPNWVHVQVREIDNIVLNQDISQYD